MTFQIRPGLETDLASINGVLKAVWGEDRTTREYFEPTFDSSRVFVATLEGRAVGFASVRERMWHPTRDYIGVNVNPAFQAHGLGVALFVALEGVLKARGKPLQTATMETQARARRFLAARGFAEIRRTYTPIFNPRKTHLKPFQSALREIERLGLEVRSLAELGRSKELKAKIARLHLAIYRDTHTWNPSPDLTLEEALKTFMGEDLIPEAMFIVLLGGKPVGISSLRGDLDELELGWFGIAPSHRELGRDATLLLVGRCLEYARSSGAATIAGEFDSLDPVAIHVLETLRVERGDAWLTFQRGA